MTHNQKHMPVKNTVLGQKCPLAIYRDAVELGKVLAGEILAGIAEARDGHYLLGCPSGRSLQTTYRQLGALAARTGADLSGLTIAMMDEYLLPRSDGYVPCPSDAHYSGRRFARREIRNVINADLAPDQRVHENNVWLPDPADPLAYETAIQEAGGIDHFLIASGASDGHVAFNAPGTSPESRTRILPLPNSIRRDNMATFPDFESLDDVPEYGVTVGLGTIADLSRAVTLVICGSHKCEAVRRLTQCSDFTSDWPASIIFRASKAKVMVDSPAASGISSQLRLQRNMFTNRNRDR